jgi:SAM-dependent methyltransferase
MRREVCGSCNSTNLHTVLDLGDSPLANVFPTSPDEVQQRYPLELLRCFRCSLVQLSEIVSDDILWSSGNYGFYTGSSWIATQHQKQYANSIMKAYPRLCRQGVLEIACNDGTMLQHFQVAGYPSLGIDPAHGPAMQAANKGLDVWVEGFGSAAALRMVVQHGHRGIVIANNVIAHVANLDDFIEGLAIVLAPAGVAVVEFQYLADLITGNQIDHVYHEHRQFFSLSSLMYSLERHGLMPTAVSQTSPQGGSLRVVISRHPFWNLSHSVNHLLKTEEWLKDEHALAGLQGRADRIRTKLRDMLHEQQQAKKRVAGYGASGKSTTLLNFCNIGPDLVQYVVDTTPMKHGRYTPGTGIPIIDPRSDSRAPDVYLSMIHNYQGEIMRQEPTFHGHWIVPIPLPVLL